MVDCRRSLTTLRPLCLQTVVMALTLCNAAGFAAFAPAFASAPSRSSVRMAVENMEGMGPETAMKVFDPLNLVSGTSEPQMLTR